MYLRLVGAAKDEGFCMTYLWYRARPFLKGRLHEKVHLMLRMATVDDVKVDTGPKISRQLWLKETNEVRMVCIWNDSSRLCS